MKKKLLYLMCGLLTILSVKGQNEGDTGNLKWKFDNGTLTISGTGAMENFTYGNTPWVNVQGISTVVVEEGVTTIGEYAFAMMTSITSMSLPSTLTSIGAHGISTNVYMSTLSVAALYVPDATADCALYLPGVELGGSTIRVPSSSVYDYKIVPPWSSHNIQGGGVLVVAKANDDSFGTVSGTGLFDGTPATLTATAETGYTFTGWTVNGQQISTANPYTFTPSQDMVVTAIFSDGAGDTDNPDGYYAEDYQWLKNYVTANVVQFAIGTTYADFDAWFDARGKSQPTDIFMIEWTESVEKRIKTILWSGPGNDSETRIPGKLSGTLDVSSLEALEILICKDNDIEVLSLPTSLKTLYCPNNKLQSLEVAPLVNLEKLDCSGNQLTTLDVSGLSGTLMSLSCADNKLTTLAVKNLTKLEGLSCNGNQLTTLDVANLTKLIDLTCYDNKLKKLDVTNLVNLTILNCWGNELTVLDTAPLEDLIILYCGNNKLKELTVTSTSLINFECNRNQIPFSKLPLVFASQDNYHNPQTVTHPQSVNPGQVVDLSSMVVAGGITTVIYDNQEIAQLDEQNTTITILPEWPLGQLTLYMRNSKFEQSGTGDASSYILNIGTSSSIHHTVTLEVAPGIDCNYQAGELSISEDSYLYLTFNAENATPNDILFLIDGVVTPFKTTGNTAGYILSSLKKDYTILIALKEYPVTLPVHQGVSFDVGSGVHPVAFGSSFSFNLTLADYIDSKEVKVYANGSEIHPLVSRSTTLSYVIDKVTGPIAVTIEGLGNPVYNVSVETGIRIYATNGCLILETPTPQFVQVYNIAGTLVAECDISGRETITLRSGIYIVRIAAQTIKIIVP